MFEAIIPLLIKYVIIPEVAKLVRGNPQITDEEVLAKLPTDIRALVGENQSFLDANRVAAGRG